MICCKRPVPSALLIAMLIIAVDQLHKWWTIMYVFGGGAEISRPVVGFGAWLVQSAPQITHPGIMLTSFFNLVMVWNKGISFGLLQRQDNLMPVLLSVMALVITGGFLYWIRQSTSRLMISAVGLIIGGALGNVWDRIRFGAVADFLDIHIGAWHWPAFNVADAAISVGVTLLLLHMLLEKPVTRVDGTTE